MKSMQANLELGMIYLEMMGVLKEGKRVGGPLGGLTDMWETCKHEMYRAEHLQQVWSAVSLPEIYINSRELCGSCLINKIECVRICSLCGKALGMCVNPSREVS